MKLYCIFGRIRGEEAPELVTAWDEYTVESNPEGYREEFEKAKGTEAYEAVREIVVTVSEKAVLAAFATPVVEGTVS